MGVDLANLLLYCTQQFGVTLGVGAETIMLAAYLISMRDRVVDEKETQYARAIKRTMALGLWLIVLSGVGITGLHLMAGQGATILTPAYLFKFLLIGLLLVLTFARKALPQSSLVEGIVGATWYSLFLVHILAPVTGWTNLFTLYAIWTIGSVLCWEIAVIMHRDKKHVKKATAVPPPKKEEPKAVPVPVSQLKLEPVSPTIVLAPDLPSAVPVAVQSVTPIAPVISPPTPPSAPPPVKKIETVSTAASSSSEKLAPSPAGKVTDTPFLPAVPALQPIPAAPHAVPPTPRIEALSNSVQKPAIAPLTTIPGGTSTPLVQEGLSAMNVMPKAPPTK